MPLLKQETDLFPCDLFDQTLATTESWWVMYTMSRQEKKLMRQLERLEIPFYGPTIARRYRAANGRLRTSIEPLFNNYVFVCGKEAARYLAFPKSLKHFAGERIVGIDWTLVQS